MHRPLPVMEPLSPPFAEHTQHGLHCSHRIRLSRSHTNQTNAWLHRCAHLIYPFKDHDGTWRTTDDVSLRPARFTCRSGDLAPRRDPGRPRPSPMRSSSEPVLPAAAPRHAYAPRVRACALETGYFVASIDRIISLLRAGAACMLVAAPKTDQHASPFNYGSLIYSRSKSLRTYIRAHTQQAHGRFSAVSGIFGGFSLATENKRQFSAVFQLIEAHH